MDDWDAEGYTPPPPPLPARLEADEVKDSWEDIEVTKKESASQPKPKDAKKPPKKDVKGKSQLAQSSDDNRKLTEKELEEIQRNSDFEMAKVAFGISDESRAALTGYDPHSKEDFTMFSNLLLEEIQKHKSKKEYPDFLSGLFKELCLNSDSEHVRRIAKELTALGAEMQKLEKAKQTKSKKPTVQVARKNDLLDDIVDASAGGYNDYDDDDFM